MCPDWSPETSFRGDRQKWIINGPVSLSKEFLKNAVVRVCDDLLRNIYLRLSATCRCEYDRRISSFLGSFFLEIRDYFDEYTDKSNVKECGWFIVTENVLCNTVFEIEKALQKGSSNCTK